MKKKNWQSMINLPTPKNISYYWNLGSILGLCLITQLLTGIMLTMNYCSNISLTFDSVIYLTLEMNYGWLLRLMHANGASFYFLCLYIHMGRSLYYQSYKFTYTWIIGMIIFFLSMITAFLGYILPWGQMSFWGASVITNLLSAIPYLGTDIVQWIWGGFSIDNVTLNRFFTLHFILPFIISLMIIIHLYYLHNSGSNNPLGIMNSNNKIMFSPTFVYKDIIGFLMFFILFLFITLYYPNMLMEPDNYTPANPMITPTHIQPEWYFLFAYSILRSIPNKLGGVVGMMSAILIFMLFPINTYKKLLIKPKLMPINKLLFWFLIMTFLLLTWIGMKSVELPFIFLSKLLTLMYFTLIMLMMFKKF